MTLTADPATARGCTRPVVLSRYKVDAEGNYVPGGESYGRCRTRRESRCPSCAEAYARDARTIIRSGIPDKRKPGQHIAFLTLTAPGREAFGSANHRLPGRRTGACPCGKRHKPGDLLLGAPVAPSKFNYDRAAAWNSALPELWRRFLIDLDRELNPGGVETYAISYVKVVEVQRRGLWHIHAVVRLDPLTKLHRPQKQMQAAIKAAAASPKVGHHRFGRQVDVKFARQRAPRRRSGESEAHYQSRVNRTDTVARFAYYLSKYATKGSEHAISKGSGGKQYQMHLTKLRGAGRKVADEWLHERTEAAKARDGYSSNRRAEVVRNSRANATAEAFGYGGQYLTKARSFGKTFKSLREEARAVIAERYPRDPSDTGWRWDADGFGYRTPEHHRWMVGYWETHYRDRGFAPPPEYIPF